MRAGVLKSMADNSVSFAQYPSKPILHVASSPAAHKLCLLEAL